MTVMQFDPFSQLDRVFKGLVSDGGRDTRRMPVPMDVYRRGDEYIVELDLPGVSPASIEVTAERNVISVRAERPVSRTDADEVLVSERPPVTMERQIYVSDILDTERIRAEYVNGVLVLRLTLSEASKPRRVNVIGSTEGTEVRADNGGSADRQPAANGGTDEARQSPQSQQAQDVAAGTATSA